MKPRSTEKATRPRINSIAVLARILDVEGFDDYAAGLCTRWWARNQQNRNDDKVQYRKQSLTTLLKKYSVTQEDKLILGKFIALHKRIGFDSGFIVGLMTGIRKPPKKAKRVK